MPNRPSIPAEITRQILIESGHRCAACGESCPLERAHIIPWHKSKEHKAEDLVCLCANCHSRADSEGWGEKTLREYKQKPWILRQYKDAEPAQGNSQERVEAAQKMSSSNQTPIVFTVVVNRDDWDNLFGGWRCPALRIPGAEVDDVFVEGSRVDESWYEAMYKHAIIRWIRQNPPEKALIVISITEELSTQGRTDRWKRISVRWKKVSITLTFISSILVVLIPAIFQYLSRTPPAHPTEHADFNLSQAVHGDCGLMTINGSVEMPAGSREKVARLRWDWGDGSTIDSFFPATHRYSQNGTYTVKVTAYVSNNETDENNIKVIISNANQNCR